MNRSTIRRMNHLTKPTRRPASLSPEVLDQAHAGPGSAPVAGHPALATGLRWPALVLSLLLTAGVLAGADGLARHEARQAQALAASWAAETARVAQASAETPLAVRAQPRRSRPA